MCGIAGFCNLKGDWRANIAKMNERMHHRGPDAEGVFASGDERVVLGHKRLSIVDLSCVCTFLVLVAKYLAQTT